MQSRWSPVLDWPDHDPRRHVPSRFLNAVQRRKNELSVGESNPAFARPVDMTGACTNRYTNRDAFFDNGIKVYGYNIVN